MQERSFNPILPPQYCVPDVEARYWGGRLYLYGSLDDLGADYYCSSRYRVFSSADLAGWTDHGISFDGELEVSWCTGELFAPDCIERDGRYYLYFCMSDGSEGVAESDSPTGPFGNAVLMEDARGIDPAVFIDEDGAGYYYWGQFDDVRCARLDSGMKSLQTDSCVQPASVALHNFHEGASVRKIGALYYLVFTDTSRHGGLATCIGYAIGTDPQGPFTYMGILVDNFGCDKASWNNHGSIECIDGDWYVFYHRSSGGSRFSRRACVERLRLNCDGSFQESEMTSQGFGGSIDARTRVSAYTACLLSGEVMFTGEAGVFMLTSIHSGDTACYRYLAFGDDLTLFRVQLACGQSGVTLDILQDLPDGNLIGSLRIPNTSSLENFVEVSVSLGGYMRGNHAVYLRFSGGEGELCRVKSFLFS